MRLEVSLGLVLLATGCIQNAFAQSVPTPVASSDAGAPPPAEPRAAQTTATRSGNAPRATPQNNSLIAPVGISSSGVFNGTGSGTRAGGAAVIPATPSSAGVRASGAAGGGMAMGARAMRAPDPVVALRFTVAVTGDGLPPEVLRRALAVRRGQFNYCFSRSRALGVTLVARFSVLRLASGGARVMVDSVTSGNPALDVCARARIAAMQFPPPSNGAPVRVVYTMRS